jgi:dynein intermediate chain
MLSSSIEWSVKLWRVRPPATTAASATGSASGPQVISPLLDINREDVVYDAKWSPHRPGVFGLVDGAVNVEIWDLFTDTEVPAVKAQPSQGRGGVLTRSLNKIAWEEREGRRVATGGLDGVVTIFEVGKALGGPVEDVPSYEWTGMKRLVSKLEQTDRGI